MGQQLVSVRMAITQLQLLLNAQRVLDIVPDEQAMLVLNVKTDI